MSWELLHYGWQSKRKLPWRCSTQVGSGGRGSGGCGDSSRRNNGVSFGESCGGVGVEIVTTLGTAGSVEL